MPSDSPQPRLRVHYQLTEEERRHSERGLVAESVLRKERELLQRLEEIRHPLDLNTLLWTPRGIRSSGTKWRIWKGSLSRKRAIGSDAVRFVLQFERVSEYDLVLIAHLRGDHEDYEDFLDRLNRGEVRAVQPQPVAVESATTNRATARWVRAPGNLVPSLVRPTITEAAAVARNLPRHEVLRMIKAGVSGVVNTDEGAVKITPKGDGSWHICGADSDTTPWREYSVQTVEREEAWELLRESADTPESDPCLILSAREREILESFQESGRLPVLIDGSAGSGKTTLLSLSLAALVDGAEFASAPNPLFVTYSNTLCDLARKRLVKSLVIQRGWKRAKAEQIAQSVCRTFSEIVDQILETSPDSDADGHRAATLADNEWKRFLHWWQGGKSRDSHVRGGASALEQFRSLQTFFFGYLPTDRSPTEDELEELEARRQAREHLYDFTETDLAKSLDVWNEYRSHIAEVGTVADRSVRALEVCVSDPDRHCTWGHVIADEIQDFSDHDLRLLICLSKFSSQGIPIARSSRNSYSTSLPLIMAGDEMQSINPSGFTFAGCRELLEETALDMGFELAAPPALERMTDNFRNLPKIAQLAVGSQRLLTALDKAKQVNIPLVHRSHEGDGAFERIAPKRPLHPSIVHALQSAEIVAVIPCRWEERKQFVAEDLPTIIGAAMNLDYLRFKTVEACKGLEYPTVVLCGFATAYSRDRQEGRSRWILNALIVAVSRGRNRVVLLDEPNAPSELLDALRAVGQFPVEEVTDISELEWSDADAASTLLSILQSLAEGTDELTRSDDELMAELTSIKTSLESLVDRNRLTPRDARRVSRASDVCTTWLSFLRSGTVDDWAILSDYGSGRLWEHVLDEAIAKSSTKALQSLFPILRVSTSENESRLFRAACVLASRGGSTENVPAAISSFIKRLYSLPSAGDKGWISRLTSQNSATAVLFADVRNTIKSLPEGWEGEELLASAELLELIDPADWTAALLRVKNVITDSAKAKGELERSRSRLPSDEYAQLELDILLVGYGLTWIDDVEARQEMLSIFRNSDSPDQDMFACMSLPGVQRCAQQKVDFLNLAIQDRNNPEPPLNKRAPALVMAALNAVVQNQADQTHATLKTARRAMEELLKK